MITRQEASDLIYAGVLGCLDKTDQTKLNEYISSGGELPSNMGELQNIAAMLPIILQAENPDPELKDKVARKLYRIKDEIRAKVNTGAVPQAEVFYSNSRANRKGSEPTGELLTSSDVENTPQEPGEIDSTPQSMEPSNELMKEGISKEDKPVDYEPVVPVRNTFESFKSTREKVLDGIFDNASESKDEIQEEIKPEVKVPTREKISTHERVITKERPTHKTSAKETPYKITSTKERGKSFERAYKKKYMTEETSNKKQGIKSWIMPSLFIILLLALVVLYLNFSSEIDNVKFTNETLKQQVNDLSVKFNSSQEIQNILESSDVRVINLHGTGINPVGKGKLILSVSQTKGYLQLSDMPALGLNSSYQLWMQLPDGKYFSLGVFNPSGRVQYFPFKIPQSDENNITEFMVTEESSTGAAEPGNKVFLTGTLQ
jgi:anti-sigma-K factor RskA